MTQLRIRRKADPHERPTFLLLPMAVVLGLGLGATSLLDAGKLAPPAAVSLAAPRLGAALETLKVAYLSRQTFEIGGQEWVLAAHPAVSDFDPADMVPAGRAEGWNVLVNKQRGLASLSARPTGYDRLYVDLGAGRYAPLRWRRVP